VRYAGSPARTLYQQGFQSMTLEIPEVLEAIAGKTSDSFRENIFFVIVKKEISER
jgi:hypothetical protein